MFISEEDMKMLAKMTGCPWFLSFPNNHCICKQYSKKQMNYLVGINKLCPEHGDKKEVVNEKT